MRRGALFVLAATLLGTLVAGPASAADPCGNDLFSDAVGITALDHSNECDSSAASTGAPGEPTPSCAVGKAIGRTLWWKYVPSVATQSHVKANTYLSTTATGTVLNTILSLWEAPGGSPDPADLVELACNDNVAANKNSRVVQALELGHTYYFQVGTHSSAAGIVKFRLKPRTWKVGIVRGNDWFLNDTFDGDAETGFEYGLSSDNKLAGGWEGHGVDTPWLRRGNLWLANDWFDGTFAKQFPYGLSSDYPLIGDWDGVDENLTPGVHRGNKWYLNNGFDGTAEISAAYGSAGDFPIVGDWDGNGTWTPGIVRGNVWYLNNDFDGDADILGFAYGRSTDVFVVGDWNGDGTMTPGVVRGNVWYLNNDFNGTADVPGFAYGSATDRKIVGDWNGIVE